MSPRSAASVAIAVCLLSAGSRARAQDPGLDPAELDRLSLEEILGMDVASATKTAVPLAKAPVSVRVITADEIARSAVRSLPELLRQVAGVDVRWNPMVPVISMRGFGQLPFSSRVLFLLDGVPQNSANKGGPRPHPVPQLFDLQAIKRIEVIRGPGSALYGENAFWGVINIVTFDGEDVAGGRVEVVGGDRDTAAGAVRYGTRVGKGSLFVSGSLGRSQFPMEFWRESDSQVETSNLLVKGKYGGWRLAYQRYADEIGGFNEVLSPTAAFRSADPLEQRVDSTSLAYDGKLAGGKVTLGGNISHARREGMFCGSCHAFNQRPEYSHPAGGESETLGELRASFEPAASHRVLVGVEGRAVRAGDRTLEMMAPSAAGVDSFDYEKLAVYLQDELSLADDRLRITTGLRYDAQAGDLFEDELSPRVAVVWTATPRTTYRASWGTAFRFPSMSERYQESWWLAVQTPTGPRGAVFFVPNPELEPEQIRTFELGGDFRPRADLDFSAHLFRSSVSRFVVVVLDSTPPPTTDRFANHPQTATILGGELEARWRPRPDVESYLTWSYEDLERHGSGVDSAGRELELTYAPSHHATAGVSAGPFAGWSGALEGTWKSSYTLPGFWTERSRLPSTSPSYALLNARLSWHPPLPGGRWRLSVYGSDLLDEAPTETLVGVDTKLPGREYWLAAEISF